MALQQCVECGANISDKAKNCPKCGCPEPFKKEEFGNCIECLAKIPLNSTSCPNCGHPAPFTKDEGNKKFQDRDVKVDDEAKQINSTTTIPP